MYGSVVQQQKEISELDILKEVNLRLKSDLEAFSKLNFDLEQRLADTETEANQLRMTVGE